MRNTKRHKTKPGLPCTHLVESEHGRVDRKESTRLKFPGTEDYQVHVPIRLISTCR